MADIQNYIAGKWSDGDTDDVVEVLDPATAEVVGQFRSASATEVDRAVAAARAAAPAWSRLTTGERSVLLAQLTDAVVANLGQLRDLEVTDAGKPFTAATDDEFPLIVDSLRFFGTAARALTTQAAAEYLPDVTTMYQREPHGVVAAITPWNYPLWMAVWKVVPALVTGNTVVVKPAENTPLSTTRFVELAADILPPGVLNIVHGRGASTGDALSKHPDVDLVSFTGSVATGRAIARAAAARPRRSILELGGNAPVIVLPDATLAEAAEKIAATSMYNAGQECMAATRLIVHESVSDDFVGLLLDHLAGVVLGDPTDPATTLGPLITERQRARVAGLVDRRPAHAKVVLGGSVVDRPGFFFEPTVVTGLEQDDELVQQEIFGPVATVQTFTTPAEAVAKANGVEFGLSGSVWTEDIERGLQMLRDLDFGQVWLNTHLAVGMDLPLGGFNQSGYGKEGGLAGLEEFTRVKHVGLRSRRPSD